MNPPAPAADLVLMDAPAPAPEVPGLDPSACPSRRVAALLAAGVPLSLLCDLLEPSGPRSARILEAERDDDALGWIPLAARHAVEGEDEEPASLGQRA